MENVLMKVGRCRQLIDRSAAPLVLKICMTVINSRGSFVCIT